MILHTVNKAGDCLDRCLALAGPDDALLLLEDGVYAVMDTPVNRLRWENSPAIASYYVLASDLAARGISDKMLPHFEVASWQDFVALTVASDKVISWG